MLMAHPAVLEDLIAQYEALTMLGAEESTPEARQRLADISYTLCVATGTRDVDMALIAARHRLSGARPEDDSLLQTTATLQPASPLQTSAPAEQVSGV
ncbi:MULTISPECIES: DUF5133 domain-containing protein [Streptomyces]|uniref:DUF5133 domain-containing protein n=1 Tax=Streptomyces canarius TaxID=285453 RepID=A0ABQ3D3W9_9ACTN|nr:DUF5133 domain-containing protein [Streptomyces canarius]GHA49158.1 hypothetical protein GCM10010345_62110 [Streptomyces canarius]